MLTTDRQATVLSDIEDLEDALSHLTEARDQITMVVGAAVLNADDEAFDDKQEIARVVRSGCVRVWQAIEAAIAVLSATLKPAQAIDAAAEE